MARGPNGAPTRAELLHAMDVAEAELASLIGRWFDSIPAPVRAELRTLAAPLEALLIRARRRGQQRGAE
jgi:hypothetical protein